MRIKAKVLSVILGLTFILTAFAACSSVLYEGRTLKSGRVGQEYFQSIDSAEGSEKELSYRLATSSTLPSGLEITDGAVSGIPEEIVSNHTFTVDVYEGKNKVKDAKFEITIERGKIVYENASAYSVINIADSGSVATATGAPNIVYELVDGTMPNGLTISEDGTILGSYSRTLKNRLVTIKASAENCEPAEAKITIDVINPFLTFTGRTLADAKQGVNYAASVAYVDEADVVVKYSLKSAYSLPEGLAMNETGVITGTPLAVKRGETFTVVAKATGYSDTETDFLLDVVLNRQSASQSEIVNFKGKELSFAYQGSYYLNQSGVASGAVSLNNNNITYELAGGAHFPNGMTFYSNGAIFGTPDEVASYEFDVVAKSVGCADVTQTFTLGVKGSKIKYSSSMTAGTATRGEDYSFSVATASAGEGVAITYSADSTALSAVGLTMSAGGLITGKPTRSLKSMNFKVTASADDFTDAVCTVYLHIQEPLTETTVFEAEYTDLTGKLGTGYSGSPSEEGLIDNGRAFAASNNYFINYMHNSNISLEFEVYTEVATTANLIVRMGSEFGAVTLTPSSFAISVNNKSVNYSGLSVPGSTSGFTTFGDCSAGSVSLEEGWNTIKLAVKANTFRQGQTGGPGVDCIKLNDAGTTLKWRPRTFNFDKVKV